MTTWTADSDAGRERGPAALLRAWAEVLLGPQQFFAERVAPGDQAPGLVFGVLVVLIAAGTRLLVVPSARIQIAGQPVLSGLLLLVVLGLFVTPVALHLLAALQTLLLRLVAPERAGVSETVQLLAYASAPCVLITVPVPAVQVVCALYATGLLVVGTSVVHNCSLPRAAVVALPVAAFVFVYGFTLLGALSTIPTPGAQ